MYCGQPVRLVYEQGRPQAMQNGRPHECSFSKLGLTLGERTLLRKEAQPRSIAKWSLWGSLFGKS